MEELKIGIHKISVTDRNNLTISGVDKVLSSNPNNLVLKLKDSDLIITGTSFNIISFNSNIIIIEGSVDALKYTKQSKVKESFLKRIFK